MADELEKKLDKLCMSLLEVLSAIDAKKRELETHLQDGYLCLAKARYSMGVDRVSKLHYAPTMIPSITVDCSKNEDCTFNLHRMNENEIPIPSEKHEASLRKRNVKNRKSDDENNEDKSKFIEDIHKSDCSSNDPVKWFGILVPQALRMAKDSFIKAAQVSCTICNLEIEMKKLRCEYKEARNLK